MYTVKMQPNKLPVLIEKDDINMYLIRAGRKFQLHKISTVYFKIFETKPYPFRQIEDKYYGMKGVDFFGNDDRDEKYFSYQYESIIINGQRYGFKEVLEIKETIVPPIIKKETLWQKVKRKVRSASR